MAKPEKYDLKANVPVDVRLGKLYHNPGRHEGTFVRVMAYVREAQETDYTYRSFLGEPELLQQLVDLGFVEEEDKLNDDGLPYVETLKDGKSDVLRIVLEEHRNDKTGRRYTEARVTHYWDGTVWVDAPEMRQYQGRASAGPPSAGPPPAAGPPAAGPPASSPQAPGPSAPAPGPAAPAAPAAPLPAPRNDRPTNDIVTIGYNYFLARMAAKTAGVGDDELVAATTTIFIEQMRNAPLAPSAGFASRLQGNRDDAGDDGLPF